MANVASLRRLTVAPMGIRWVWVRDVWVCKDPKATQGVFVHCFEGENKLK